MIAVDAVAISPCRRPAVSSKRLLVRRVDPADRRRTLLRLSVKRGEEVYSEVVPVLYAAEQCGALGAHPRTSSPWRCAG